MELHVTEKKPVERQGSFREFRQFTASFASIPMHYFLASCHQVKGSYPQNTWEVPPGRAVSTSVSIHWGFWWRQNLGPQDLEVYCSLFLVTLLKPHQISKIILWGKGAIFLRFAIFLNDFIPLSSTLEGLEFANIYSICSYWRAYGLPLWLLNSW